MAIPKRDSELETISELTEKIESLERRINIENSRQARDWWGKHVRIMRMVQRKNALRERRAELLRRAYS